MANIVVTSTTNAVKVDFGDYAAAVGRKCGTWNKKHIVNFGLQDDDSMVIAHTLEEPKWTLSYTNGTSAMIVDTVDGVAPTDNEDLHNKLSALIE